MRLDLNLNWASGWWTLAFLIGFLAVMIHTAWTIQRWLALRHGPHPRSVKTAAFWFMRQDIGNDVLGLAMTLAGILAIVRIPTYTIHLLEIGATAFMVNKLWNLYDDGRVQELIRQKKGD